MNSNRSIILVLGPTAGGKTELAIELAQRLPGGGECISADSMQVYRGMDIGTAKPPPLMRDRVPHHLVDIVDSCDETFSVDRWLELAERAISEIRARSRWPIIVGGTNLYVQAFLGGLTDSPPPDADLRRELNDIEQTELRGQLEAADPEAASRIHANDRKRTIRALEIFKHTSLAGKRLSSLQTLEGGWEAGPTRDDVLIIGMEYPVESINRRINARVKAMMESGLVGEARNLYESGQLGRNAREALGYKQLIEHFEGHLTLDEAVEQIKIQSRRFAKNQRTWLRRFRAYPGSVWLAAEGKSADELVDEAEAAIRAQNEPISGQ